MTITIDLEPMAKAMIKNLNIKNMGETPSGWSDYILDYLTEKYNLEGELSCAIEEILNAQG